MVGFRPPSSLRTLVLAPTPFSLQTSLPTPLPQGEGDGGRRGPKVSEKGPSPHPRPCRETYSPSEKGAERGRAQGDEGRTKKTAHTGTVGLVVAVHTSTSRTRGEGREIQATPTRFKGTCPLESRSKTNCLGSFRVEGLVFTSPTSPSDPGGEGVGSTGRGRRRPGRVSGYSFLGTVEGSPLLQGSPFLRSSTWTATPQTLPVLVSRSVRFPTGLSM